MTTTRYMLRQVLYTHTQRTMFNFAALKVVRVEENLSNNKRPGFPFGISALTLTYTRNRLQTI